VGASRRSPATTASAGRCSRWRKRYEDDGLEDRSSAPLHCPNVTSLEVVAKIVHLRQHYYLGPLKISMYLKRYHDVEMSYSGVWRVLKRLDMTRLPAFRRHNYTPSGGSATRGRAQSTRCR
jgi:transposase